MTKKTDAAPVNRLANLGTARQRRRLDALCAEYKEHGEVEAEARAAKRDLMTDIRALTKKLGVEEEGVVGRTWRLSWSAGRPSLSKERLIEQGVTLKQIAAATKRGAGFYKVLAGGEEEA